MIRILRKKMKGIIATKSNDDNTNLIINPPPDKVEGKCDRSRWRVDPDVHVTVAACGF